MGLGIRVSNSYFIKRIERIIMNTYHIILKTTLEANDEVEAEDLFYIKIDENSTDFELKVEGIIDMVTKEEADYMVKKNILLDAVVTMMMTRSTKEEIVDFGVMNGFKEKYVLDVIDMVICAARVSISVSNRRNIQEEGK